jgi:hypothetical protein
MEFDLWQTIIQNDSEIAGLVIIKIPILHKPLVPMKYCHYTTTKGVFVRKVISLDFDWIHSLS